MRAASDSILSAVEQTEVGEDRLTEVLACVAHVNHRFASALVRMAGLGVDKGERHVVGTQRATPGGRRVDMEIAVYRGLRPTRLVWIEVKAGAAYQPNQLADYAEQVKDPVWGAPDGRVLTIIPPGDSPQLDLSPGAARWRSVTWADVALEADRLGRAWGHARWRRDAMAPSAPAQWRYLAELLLRLEQKEYARMQPLTPEDVVAAPRVVTLPRMIEDLMRAAREGITGVVREPGKFKGLKGGCFQVFVPGEPKWFNDPARFGNAYPELQYWFEETWTPDRRGAPAFFAGVTFNEIADHTRQALLDEEWQRGLPDGVTVGGDRRLLRVVRTKYLSELVVAGVTFDEQVQALRAWASMAFADIMDNVEPPGGR